MKIYAPKNEEIVNAMHESSWRLFIDKDGDSIWKKRKYVCIIIDKAYYSLTLKEATARDMIEWDEDFVKAHNVSVHFSTYAANRDAFEQCCEELGMTRQA